jgi:hypothetical protein
VSEKRNGGGKQSFPPPFMSGMIEVDPPPSRQNQLLRQLVKRARARTRPPLLRPPQPHPASPRPLSPLYNACGDAAADCCVVARALAIRAKDGALPNAVAVAVAAQAGWSTSLTVVRGSTGGAAECARSGDFAKRSAVPMALNITSRAIRAS